MSNLTPEQIKQQRLEKFRSMGFPSTAGLISESTEVSVAANKDVYKTLQDIKRGAKKQFFKEFVKATDGKTASGYQIPESKQSKKRPADSPKSNNAVAPQTFNVPKSQEAYSLERMMLGDPGINISSTINSTGVPSGDLVSEIDIPFDPVSALRNRSSQSSHNQSNSSPSYSNNQMSEIKEMMQIMLEQNKPSYDLKVLKEMMEVIAKNVAENTIKNVISEFLAENKKKNVYEVYNKDKNIIKVGNQLYKMVPVTVKAKN